MDQQQITIIEFHLSKHGKLKLPQECRQFDYLMLNRVLLRKSHPVEFLQRCGQLLLDDGFAIVNEVTKDYEIGWSQSLKRD